MSFVRQSCENGHGALVGLTYVKVQVWRITFLFLTGKMVSGICRSYICKRYKCAKACREQTSSLTLPGLPFWDEFGTFWIILFNGFFASLFQ